MATEQVGNPAKERRSVERKIDIVTPDWFRAFAEAHLSDEENIRKMSSEIGKFNVAKLNEYLGGAVNELPYEIVEILFSSGSDDIGVAGILTRMRTEYHKKHPELVKITPYFIGARGNILLDNGNLHSPAVLRRLAVDDTCIHLTSGRDGMDDTDRKRVREELSADAVKTIEVF